MRIKTQLNSAAHEKETPKYSCNKTTNMIRLLVKHSRSFKWSWVFILRESYFKGHFTYCCIEIKIDFVKNTIVITSLEVFDCSSRNNTDTNSNANAIDRKYLLIYLFPIFTTKVLILIYLFYLFNINFQLIFSNEYDTELSW